MSHPKAKKQKTEDDKNADEQSVFVYNGQRRKEIQRDAHRIVVDVCVQRIVDNIFAEMRYLQSVSFPKNLRIIGMGSFRDCRCLVDVSFHDEGELHAIEERTFLGCESLADIDLPHGLKRIGRLAFYNCRSLCNVTIPETLEIIGQSAFIACISLSGIALPSSLERISFDAFSSCTNLLGVEMATGMKVTTTTQPCFPHCKSLVNISIPIPHTSIGRYSHYIFEQCRFLKGRKNISRLCRRFDRLPVHKVCYHSSVSTSDELMQVLDASNSDARDDNLEDAFGMTPFHIMATASRLREDILELLLNRYRSEILYQQDEQEKTMMEYLLKRVSSNAVLLIQTILRKTIMEKLSDWGLGSELLSKKLELSNCTTIGTRCQSVQDFFNDVGHYIRFEITSLMELALWKKRMGDVKAEESSSSVAASDSNSIMIDREGCRCTSGSEVVIKNVLGYLWDDDFEKFETALEIFPLCSTKIFTDDDDESSSSESSSSESSSSEEDEFEEDESFADSDDSSVYGGMIFELSDSSDDDTSDDDSSSDESEN